MKRDARLRQLREADRHVDVGGGKVGPPAAAVAVAVVDQPAEVEPAVEVVVGGDALPEREGTLKLCGADAGRDASTRNDTNDSNVPNDHALRNAVSSART